MSSSTPFTVPLSEGIRSALPIIFSSTSDSVPDIRALTCSGILSDGPVYKIEALPDKRLAVWYVEPPAALEFMAKYHDGKVTVDGKELTVALKQPDLVIPADTLGAIREEGAARIVRIVFDADPTTLDSITIDEVLALGDGTECPEAGTVRVTKARTVSLRELWGVQNYNSVKLLVPPRPFRRLVKDIGQEVSHNPLQWETKAFDCIQEAAEAFLTTLLRDKTIPGVDLDFTINQIEVEFSSIPLAIRAREKLRAQASPFEGCTVEYGEETDDEIHRFASKPWQSYLIKVLDEEYCILTISDLATVEEPDTSDDEVH